MKIMPVRSARAACSARNRAIAASTPSGRSVTRNLIANIRSRNS